MSSAILTLAQASLEIALSQVGVQEQPHGSNGGMEINQYLRSVGLGAGYAWCMAFDYWCVDQACEKLGRKNPLVKTGGVLRQWNETTLPRISQADYRLAQPGDIFIMNFGGGLGHTGFVVSKFKSSIYTVEGNTNAKGSREGYEVARRIRPANTITGFIHLQ